MPTTLFERGCVPPFIDDIVIRSGDRIFVSYRDLLKSWNATGALDLRNGRKRQLDEMIGKFNRTGKVTLDIKFIRACLPDNIPDEGSGAVTPSSMMAGAVAIAVGTIGLVAAGVTIFAAGVAFGNALEDATNDGKGGVTVQLNDDGEGVEISAGK